MYSDELFRYLEERRYILSTNEYLHVCYTCPQINDVKYNAFSDEFEIWTDDRYNFRFKVKKE